MENQSLTQNNSKLVENKDKIVNSIKDNLNYIYIVLMILVNIFVSLFEIQDGRIGLTYPHSLLGWVLWIVRMLLQTFIGVAILNAFRRQGIKLGHNYIKETYDKYKKAMLQSQSIKSPRSLHQYLTGYGAKDSLAKSVVYIISGVAVNSVIIGANLNNLLSLVVNIIFAIAFGIKAMIEAEEFVTSELIMWYQLKIAEVTDHKLEPAKGDNQCQTLIMTESTISKEITQDRLNLIEEKMLNKTND